MEKFMDEDFLLTTPTAKWLYHEVAKKLPMNVTQLPVCSTGNQSAFQASSDSSGRNSAKNSRLRRV